jgi:uncharacterized protein (TIGR04255 family)
MSGTSSSQSENPLIDAAPQEVPLPRAPLVTVLAQVKYGPVLAINRGDFIAPLQEALRSEYPLLRQERVQGFFFQNAEAEVIAPEVIWRFANEEKTWHVSVSPTFVALETRAYVSRNDFMDRLGRVLAALAEHVKPTLIERVGLRYVDRLTGRDVDRLSDLVREEMLGTLNTPLKIQTLLALQEGLYELPNERARLRARWGLVPAGSTPDPATIPAVTTPSWLLDLDVFAENQEPFDQGEIIASLRQYAERTYTFFRWCVTPQFLEHFGGES